MGEDELAPEDGLAGDQRRADAVGTGNRRVDEAVTRLDDLEDTPLDEHPAILEQVHDRLREVLGEVSPDRPGSP
jgi:galactokinase